MSDSQLGGEQPVQPDPQHIVAALQEELDRVNANRVYLLAVLRQMRQEFREAQEMWSIERESLVKGRETAGEGPE